MTISARAVAEEIRRRVPGVGDVKLHKLLYYAQGHHMATFGEPLFSESISAWDLGPVVGTLWHRDRIEGPGQDAADPLDEAQLNTVGYVLARYGGMTGKDLIRLSHSEAPWLEADRDRAPGTGVRIATDRIRAYFVLVSHDDEDDGPLLDEEVLRDMLAGAAERSGRPVKEDTMDELLARRRAVG